MTSKQHLLLASSALFALGLSPSWAGPCTDQIAEIQKTMSSMDAGSGPTMRAGSAQNPNTTSSTAPNPGSPGSSPAGAGSNAAAGQSTSGTAGSSATVPNVSANPAQTQRAGEAPKTDATVAMNTASQGRATSAQDVRSQQQGQPTSSQIAQGSAQPASGSQPQADKMMQVNAALDRARTADQQGDNEGCTRALGEAKQLVGTR
jgi:hypothetical protein